MRFKKSPQLPGAGRTRAGHHHGSHTPTSPGAILLSKMAYQPKHIGRQCIIRLPISFPAGIVQVVANNPNPAQLSFKIRNASVFESIVPNLKLVTPSELLSTPDGKVFEFKMDALKELLKVQSEMNPNAAYFNIDLLKYQVRYFLYFYFCTC